MSLHACTHGVPKPRQLFTLVGKRMKISKVENILKKSKILYETSSKPLIQEITNVPKDWNLYDTWRISIEFYNEQGLNIIPLIRGSKKPAIKWKEFQERKSSYREIEEWFFTSLAKASFGLQFNTFMTHYLRRKLREKWFNTTKEEWIDETTPLLYQEPWIYVEWYKEFPNTPEEFYSLLISKDFNQFMKEHVEKKHTWGWTKLFAKEKPELINLHIVLLRAQEETAQYKEGLETCQILLSEFKRFWLKGYPQQFRTQAKNNTSIGDIAFAWLLTNEGKNDKLTAIKVASMLNMNVATCRRSVMPNIAKLEPLLKLFGIVIAGRGQG